MAAVIVPPRAGVLSAVGLLCAPRQRDLVRSWPTRPRSRDGLDAALAELAAARRSRRSVDATRPSRPRSTAATPDRATS